MSRPEEKPPTDKPVTVNAKLLAWVLRVVVSSLAFICISVVLVLLYAFFDHNVDNDKIFEVIGPAFNMVVGAFVGLLGGISLRGK